MSNGRYTSFSNFRQSREMQANPRIAVVSAPAYSAFVTDKPPGLDVAVSQPKKGQAQPPINLYTPQPSPSQQGNFKETIEVMGVYDPTRFSQFANVSINTSPNDTVALQATDSLRTYLFVLNIGANPVFIAFSRAPTIDDIPLVTGGSGFFELNYSIPQNDLHVISPAGASRVAIMYGTKQV